MSQYLAEKPSGFRFIDNDGSWVQQWRGLVSTRRNEIYTEEVYETFIKRHDAQQNATAPQTENNNLTKS